MIDLEMQRELAAQMLGNEVILDWYEYFQEFDKLHGSHPVPIDNKLLYRDGWMHSASYDGDEVKPPDDNVALKVLLARYWTARLDLLKGRYSNLSQEIQGLELLQRGRSLPLRQRFVYMGETGEPVIEQKTLDMDALKRKLTWVAEDCVECEFMLQRIDAANVHQSREDFLKPLDPEIFRTMLKGQREAADAQRKPSDKTPPTRTAGGMEWFSQNDNPGANPKTYGAPTETGEDE